MITKFRSIAVIALLATAVFSYSSCKKDTTSKADTDNTAIGTQIALNLYNSFNGSFGNTDLGSGAPVVNSTVKNGIKLNSFTCGQVIETPVNTTTSQGDSVKNTIVGTNKKVINCDGNVVTGYTLTATTSSIGFKPTYTFDYLVKENYTLKSLAANYAKIGVNGTQTSVIKTQQKSDATKSSVQNNAYDLKDFVIDSSSRPFDITSGTATFVSTGTANGKAFSFKGTITFIGGHKVKISLDGKVITVDLLTGKPIK
ncbi:hypothetical protein [Mucilaginibacter aquariorum]|uniref:Lipoprotein n=1 Tax=Mucilaginibacter aquariorum TaxID=2967225 RepID=A0ABT1T456_9SPHI|nr:hypothetical protein [Mucilaginibacter aquariorum]MCQ6959402.1 hypothetical protein [Mucilaginibacter aquariorum]